MRLDIRDRWTAALRSGDYPQTRGALHRLEQEEGGHPVGFCCLGVLCELAVADGITERVPSDDDDAVEAYRDTLPSGEVTAQEAILPHEVMAWAGLRGSGFVSLGDRGPLSSINDRGATFAKIADLIEEHL